MEYLKGWAEMCFRVNSIDTTLPSNSPATLPIGISPRNRALILLSICLSGAPRCDSLSCSSSSSRGGTKSPRRGVDLGSPDNEVNLSQRFLNSP